MPEVVMEAEPSAEVVADVDAQLGEILNEDATETPEAETAPLEEGAEAAPEEPEAVGGYKTTETGEYIIPKADLDRLTGLQKYAEEVQQRFATATDAETAFADMSSWRMLNNDYLTGDPNAIESILDFFAGRQTNNPQTQQQSRASFTRMAEKMPDVLREVQPEAYEKLVSSLLDREIEAHYQRAAQTGDPEDMLAAQRLDWGKTGQYRTTLDRVDPNKAAVDRLAQERQQVQQQRQELANGEWNNFNQQALSGPKWQQFDGEIAKALAPLTGKFSDVWIKAIHNQIASEIRNALKNDAWAQHHQTEFRGLQQSFLNGWRPGQRTSDALKPRVAAHINDFMVRVRRMLPSIAAPIVNGATNARVANSTNGQRSAAPPKPQAAATARNTTNGQFTRRADPRDLNENSEWKSLWK